MTAGRRLYRLAERGVSPEEHPQIPNSGRAPDWEGIRLFLEIARRGSFRSASESLGLSINVLRRKIDELERGLGLKLLTRHVDGVRVTLCEDARGRSSRLPDLTGLTLRPVCSRRVPISRQPKRAALEPLWQLAGIARLCRSGACSKHHAIPVCWQWAASRTLQATRLFTDHGTK